MELQLSRGVPVIKLEPGKIMLKQTLKFWQLWIIEPYSLLIQTFFNFGEAADQIPEKMERNEYFQRLARLSLPFYTVTYLLSLIALPIFAIWYGETIPSPFPFTKVAIVCAICELLTLIAGSFGRTKFTFLLTIGLGLPISIGLGASIATF
jgi:hypothetical protein